MRLTEEKLLQILQEITSKPENTQKDVLKWVSMLVAGVLVTIVGGSIMWIVSNTNGNSTRLTTLETQFSQISSQNSSMISKLDILLKERFDIDDDQAALNNFYIAKISPIEKQAYKISEIMRRLEAVEGKIRQSEYATQKRSNSLKEY